MPFQTEQLDALFTGLQLMGQPHRDLYFENCVFKGCRFTEGSFTNCVFEECRFENCDLSLVQVNGSSFLETTFLECKCIGINWSVASQRFSPRFEKCQLNSSSFLERKITGLVLTNCTAHEVNFSGAKLHNASFKGTDFDQALFNQTDLKEADFTDAQNYSIDVKNNTVTGATFSLPDVVRLLDSFRIKIV